MIDAETKPSASVSPIAGFSARFNLLLDRAGFPEENRVVLGSRRFGVAHNTFKSWCAADRSPKHAQLNELVESLLSDTSGRYNPKAVMAWLLYGDAVPNPFDDESDAVGLVELYLEIADVAKQERVDFASLPREVRNLILRRARMMLGADNHRPDANLQLNNAALSMVVGMLQTARSMA